MTAAAARQRRSLGTRLATSTALVAAFAIAVFAVVVAVVLWQHERAEDAAAATAADEVLAQLAVALAVTTPLVLGLVVLVTRRLARRLTARIDGVIDQATRMTHADLGQRLPITAADDELDAMSIALNGLFDRLELGLAAQTQFVADASHELRTPLSVLRAELEVARRHPRPTAAWEALADRAAAEVARMTEMVEALLRLAQTAAAAPLATPLDGDDLLDHLVTRWRPVAAQAGVRIERGGDAAGGLRGDAEALAVALDNLVKNALAHAPPASVVTVTAARTADHLTLVVDDQGPGVAVADRARIFLPFARGHGAADRDRRDGVGLGLSVAQRVVVAHGGELMVGDAPGGGARFTVRLPRARSAPATIEV